MITCKTCDGAGEVYKESRAGLEICDDCNGTGWHLPEQACERGEALEGCKHCFELAYRHRGAGQARRCGRCERAEGPIMYECPHCEGIGAQEHALGSFPCPACNGAGKRNFPLQRPEDVFPQVSFNWSLVPVLVIGCLMWWGIVTLCISIF